MLFAILGVLSAVIFLLGDAPYLRDTLKVSSKTKPHRVTWGIATLSNAVGFANQWASGATNSLWLFGAGTLMVGTIFLASLKHGTGGHNKADVIAIIICLLGLGLWVTSHSPIYSIVANLLVDIVALLPTFAKAKKHPETETKIAWLVGTISSLLATISVGKWDIQLLLLPAASVILQAYMIYILYFMHRQSATKRV